MRKITFSRGLFVALFLLFAFQSYSYGQGDPKAEAKRLYMEGRSLEKQNKYQEAIGKYEQASKLDDLEYRYSYAAGKAYYRLKDYDNAVDMFDATIEKNPNYTVPYILAAKVFTRQKDYDKAINYYEEAFKYEQHPKKKVSYKLMIVKMLIALKRQDEVLVHIQDAKNVDPTNLNILYYDAKFNNEQGNYEAAKFSMETATTQLRDEPPAKSAKFYYELGLAYNNLGDYQNAKSAWDKANFGPYKKLIAQQMSKNSPSYYYKMAISYYYSSQYSDAQTQLDKALELQNNFAPAYILMGNMARKRGDYNAAVSNFGQAISMESDPGKKAKYQMSTMRLQIESGDYSGALSNCNALLNSNPGNRTIAYYKAMAQYKLGQYSGSISTLETLLNTPGLDGKSKAQYSFLLGMAAKNTDSQRAIEAFKAAMGGVFKAAAKNELDKLMGKS